MVVRISHLFLDHYILSISIKHLAKGFQAFFCLIVYDVLHHLSNCSYLVLIVQEILQQPFHMKAELSLLGIVAKSVHIDACICVNPVTNLDRLISREGV